MTCNQGTADLKQKVLLPPAPKLLKHPQCRLRLVHCNPKWKKDDTLNYRWKRV